MTKPTTVTGQVTILPPEDFRETESFRHRRDGWTPLRQRAFLRALAETGCVRQACARVRLSTTSAYRVRRLVPAFAREWDRALSLVAPILEHAAYERAVEGWEDPIYYAGKVVGHRRRYSDSMLRLLIQRGATPAVGQGTSQDDLVAIAKEAAKRAGGYFCTPASEEQTNASLRKKLDALARHQARQEERKKIAETIGPADDLG